LGYDKEGLSKNKIKLRLEPAQKIKNEKRKKERKKEE
jgi:hypothetical protein